MQGTRVIPGRVQIMPVCRLHLRNGVDIVFENVKRSVRQVQLTRYFLTILFLRYIFYILQFEILCNIPSINRPPGVNFFFTAVLLFSYIGNLSREYVHSMLQNIKTTTILNV